MTKLSNPPLRMLRGAAGLDIWQDTLTEKVLSSTSCGEVQPVDKSPPPQLPEYFYVVRMECKDKERYPAIGGVGPLASVLKCSSYLC